MKRIVIIGISAVCLAGCTSSKPQRVHGWQSLSSHIAQGYHPREYYRSPQFYIAKARSRLATVYPSLEYGEYECLGPYVPCETGPSSDLRSQIRVEFYKHLPARWRITTYDYVEIVITKDGKPIRHRRFEMEDGADAIKKIIEMQNQALNRTR